MQRWANWVKQYCQIPAEKESPTSTYTRRTTGDSEKQQNQELQTKNNMEIQKELTYIRRTSALYRAMTRNVTMQQWVINDYAESGVNQAIKQLKSNKSNGADGIPGEAYKALGAQITKPLTIILNRIKKGTSENGKHGALVQYGFELA